MSWFKPVEASSALRTVLACSWTAAPTGRHRLVPDTCIDLLWTSTNELWVCGPERTGWDFEVPPGSTIAGVRFRPGTGPALLGFSAATIADRRVTLASILDETTETAVLAETGGCSDVDEVRAVLESFVSRLAATIGSRADTTQHLEFSDRVLDVLASSPLANAARLAHDLGMTPRQLLRRSLYSFGYGPATLARLLRLQRFLALASTSKHDRHRSISALAIDAGYSDQSHLTRECRLIGRMTPTALLDEYQPTFPDMSDPFKTTEPFAVTMSDRAMIDRIRTDSGRTRRHRGSSDR